MDCTRAMAGRIEASLNTNHRYTTLQDTQKASQPPPPHTLCAPYAIPLYCTNYVCVSVAALACTLVSWFQSLSLAALSHVITVLEYRSLTCHTYAVGIHAILCCSMFKSHEIAVCSVQADKKLRNDYVCISNPVVLNPLCIVHVPRSEGCAGVCPCTFGYVNIREEWSSMILITATVFPPLSAPFPSLPSPPQQYLATHKPLPLYSRGS